MPENDQQPQHNDHSYVFTCNCSPACQCVGCSSQQAKLKNLQNEYYEFKEIVTKSKSRFWPKINKPTLLRYFWPVIKKLGSPIEQLLTVSSIPIAIITESLSGIFEIVSSQIIKIWVKMLAATLHPLMFWPSKQVIRKHLPKAPKDYQHLQCTIGCTENFTERLRELELQAFTWSDYKNTRTFCVCITPNGAISFCHRHGVGRPLTRRSPGNRASYIWWNPMTWKQTGGIPVIAWIHLVLMQSMYPSCQIVMICIDPVNKCQKNIWQNTLLDLHKTYSSNF